MGKKYTKNKKMKKKWWRTETENRKMYKAASERGLGLSKDLRCKFSCNKTKLVQFSCVTDSRRRCARQHSVMRSAPTALVSPGKGKWTAHAKKKVALSKRPNPTRF